jgi:hypothetical protein
MPGGPSDGSILPEGWTWSDVGHGGLDILGLVPVWGEGADVANAVWYANEAKYLEAGLSLISVVPVVGDVIGKGGKLASKLGGPALKKLLPILRKMDFAKALAPFRKHPKLAPYVDKMVAALEKWRDELIDRATNCQSCPKGGGGAPKPGSRAADIAAKGDFKTPHDRSVFYSGPGNREKALHAAQNGGVPIDATPGGKALNAENLYGEFSPVTNKEADAIWSKASETFANAASGDVTAFVRGALPNRVFGSTELPLLLKNGNVTSINGISAAALRAMEATKPGSAFAAVVAKAPH